MMRVLFAALILILATNHISGQSSADFASINDQLQTRKPSTIKSQKQSIAQDKNAFDLASKILFTTYRNLISSQDGSRCRFYPTCSAYCKEAIHQHGLIRGTIQGIDRLTRCNGLSPKKYTIDRERRKLIDHVQ